MITLDLSILNQKGTPMFNSDIFANRPAAGVVGRIFISTDTYEFYRDTGSAWDAIGGSGSGITGSGTAGTLPIWTGSSVLGDSTLLEGATKFTTTKDFQADGYYLSGMTAGTGALYYNSLPEDRVTVANYNAGGTVYIEVNGGQYATIFGADKSLTNNGYISAVPTLTAANNASSLASYGINTLSYAAGFSSNNIGALYGGIAGFNLQTFAGSATFAQANVASGGASVNSIDFSSAGSTITMTQAAGIRVMSGQQNLFQYQGTNSGTITHAAISQNTGFYRPTAATGILTITNAYSLLLNALDDYGAGFSFTNRWGIYQAGASDKNYFAANMLLGSTTDNGNRLQVTGAGTFTGNITSGSVSSGPIISVYASSYGNHGFFRAIGTDGVDKLQIGALGANEAFLYSPAGVKQSFYTGGNLSMTLNASGNLGLGVVPSNWRTSEKVIQIGSSSSIYDVFGLTLVGNNYYTNSSNDSIYLNNGAASFYIQASGQHQWNNAPIGTAGNVIPFTAAMTLNASGNLLLGNTQNRLRLTVSGANSNAPTLGVASGTTIFANAASTSEYGMNFGVATTGYGWIQQHRFDGSATAYPLLLQPSGGNLLIGRTNDVGAKLQVNGDVAIYGYSYGGALTINASVNPVTALDANNQIQIGESSQNINYRLNLGYINYAGSFIGNIQSVFAGSGGLLSINASGGNVSVGSLQDTGSKFFVDGSFRIDGQRSGSAGGNSGQHLIINCDGVSYKIALLNP